MLQSTQWFVFALERLAAPYITSSVLSTLERNTAHSFCKVRLGLFENMQKEDHRPSFMRDVKRQLQREMLIKQAQPGMATQSKVHYALQLRRRNESLRASALPTVSAYSPSIIPFSSEEMKKIGSSERMSPLMYSGAIRNSAQDLLGRDRVPLQTPVTQISGSEKLADAVGRQMAQKGFDALSAQMMTSYMLEHPAAIEQLRKELKKERRSLRQERVLLAVGHKHVFPEELLFAGRTTAFPKEPMAVSGSDLCSTRTGGPSKILQNCAVSIEDERFELPPIPLFRDVPSRSVLRQATTGGVPARSQLGDHFPTYVCQGIPITFDPPTVATLTAQCGRATDAVVAQQVSDFGPLDVMPVLEEMRLLRNCGGRSVSPQPEGSHRSPTPHASQRWKQCCGCIEKEELDLFEHILSQREDPGAARKHNPTVKVVEAPEGILKQLLREVDSDSEGSEDGMIDARCVICHTSKATAGSTAGKARANKRASLASIGSHRASEALLRWKALHQLAQVEANASLGSLLASRDEQNLIVRQNLRSLAEVSDKARKDAEGWLRSRSGASPTPNGSCWTAPCHRIVQQRIRWASCVKFWERLAQFLSLLQWPQTEGQVELLQVLQGIVEDQGYLSPCTLLMWLHGCGPQLCRVREYYRVLVYVRAALGLPHSVLQAWIKLPSVKLAGFELASD